MTNELQTKNQNPLESVVGIKAIENASVMADKLKDIIEKQKLYTTIQGNKHVHATGWSTLGAMLGVFPIPVGDPEKLPGEKGEVKYRAKIVLKTLGGKEVGGGSAICSNLEKGKNNNPEYSISSMAQTRATGKAFRLSFAWIITMAGYNATPLEEMDGIDVSNTKPKSIEAEVVNDKPTDFRKISRSDWKKEEWSKLCQEAKEVGVDPLVILKKCNIARLNMNSLDRPLTELQKAVREAKENATS